MNKTMASLTIAFGLGTSALVLAPYIIHEVNRPDVGETLPDGSIYAGSYNGYSLIATAEDIPAPLGWLQAIKACLVLKEHGHDDWFLPGDGPLETLYKAQNTGDFKGTFNSDAGQEWYWSGSVSQHTTANEETKAAITVLHIHKKDLTGGTKQTIFMQSALPDLANARCVRVDPGLE